ncbi:MAG: hypothetical protein O6931_09180 [Gammaproteobacteria bacterium]|nr:hypothetical protein [Gammaproteobacteria bacterium]
MTLRILIICLALAGPAEIVAASATNAEAQVNHQRYSKANLRIAQNERFTLDQAVDKVRAMYGGKIIKASTQRQKGHPIHIIKILGDDGRVKTVRIDGITGQEL